MVRHARRQRGFVRYSLRRVLLQHARPLPNCQSDARSMLGNAVEDATRFVETAASEY
jgi:hypothetical protein